MSERVVLVCALADAPWVAPGSVFNRACAVCARTVMVAPTGQQKLRQHPHILILCGSCFVESWKSGDTLELAAPLEEMERERKGMQPNLRRCRN